jgi:hypothetical protein
MRKRCRGYSGDSAKPFANQTTSSIRTTAWGVEGGISKNPESSGVGCSRLELIRVASRIP